MRGVEVRLRVLRFGVFPVVGFSADGSSKRCVDRKDGGLVEFGKNAPALRLEEYVSTCPRSWWTADFSRCQDQSMPVNCG